MQRNMDGLNVITYNFGVRTGLLGVDRVLDRADQWLTTTS
jgi:hypothetical protein